MWTLRSKALDTIELKVNKAMQIDLESLCCFRIVFCLFTVLLNWKSYTWIGSVPDAFFDPPMLSFASLLTEFPSLAFFQTLDILIGVFTFTLFIGFFTRLSTLSLLILIIVGNTFSYSLGKIDHSVLYLCVLLAMCFQDWGAVLSVDALFQRSRKTIVGKGEKTVDLTFLAVLITFGFFTAGFGKALNWIDFDLTTSGFLSWFYDGYFNHNRDQLLAPAILKIDIPLLWELVDASAVIFELGFLLAILSRRSWYLWLTIACIFHLMNCLLLNIAFNANAAAYLAFVPWARLPIYRDYFQTHPSRGVTALSVFGIAMIALWLSPARLTNAGFHLLASIGIANRLIISCGIWAVMLSIFLYSFSAFVNLPLVQTTSDQKRIHENT